MKKIVSLILCMLTVFCLFSCGKESKTFDLLIDAEKSGPGYITADLTLEGLEGDYEIYYAQGNKKYEGTEKIADAVGGGTVHFEKIFLPTMCSSLLIVNDEGERHKAEIPIGYVALPEDEF